MKQSVSDEQVIFAGMPRKSNLLQEYVGKEDGCLGGKKKQNNKKKKNKAFIKI